MDKTPKVLGIASIALGSLVSLGSLGGMAAKPAAKAGLGWASQFVRGLPRPDGGQGPNFDDFAQRYSELLDAMQPYQLAQSAAMLVFSAALVVIGIAMLLRRRWSRRAAKGWAVAALCFIPVIIWLQAFVIQPIAQERVFSLVQLPRENEAMVAEQRRMMGAMRTVQTAMTVASSVGIYAPFPVVLLALLKRKKSEAWFAPPPGEPGQAAP